MYVFPETQAAVAAFWSHLHRRVAAKGFDVADVTFDRNRRPVPDSIGPEIFFTQICGYPLFKKFRHQGRMLATPCYDFPGCSGPDHCGFFMVRADAPENELEQMRAKIFGCNSLLSNSGMNLPRLSLARIAQGRNFFSSVVITGGHLDSLARLKDRTIDICSIDNVTWGFLVKCRPDAARDFRVLAQTVSSPSLPFVTSVRTPESEVEALRESLIEMMTDGETTSVRKDLNLVGLAVPDVAAYERLAGYEREAAELGYPEIA
ncbi:MAG: PhnD/SsuA/transferrin family substrate-binding protein [Methylobacteriaceae bacterium]|nr:PhnD/SsuA/transferrin family substrate-binding protein [Methylobacteriaceae bacterium]